MKIRRSCFSGVLIAVLLGVGGSPLLTAAELPDAFRPGIADVVQQVAPGVVSVGVSGHAAQSNNPLLNDPNFRRFFDLPDEQPNRPTQGVGSGVIIDAGEGLVLTNNHVVEGAEEITITLSDRREFKASVIGRDPGTDIALLKIDADRLTAVTLSDSSTLLVGDFVLAIGNPFGLGQTVTTGIVSALGRSGINPDGYEDYIQTDASINPGNSGGALVDYNGHLIGINTAIIAPSGGNIGIGFAVPVNMAMQVVTQLQEFGEVSRGRLGVFINNLTPDDAELMGLEVDSGALVSSVQPDSAADKAGLQAGDVITRLNDTVIDSGGELRNLVGLTRAGENVDITLIRNGDVQHYTVTLGGAPAEMAAAAEPAELGGVLEGVQLSAYDSGDGEKGVQVVAVAPGTRAYVNGLRANDIITAINRKSVTSPEELAGILEQSPGGITLNLVREGQAIFMIMR